MNNNLTTLFLTALLESVDIIILVCLCGTHSEAG